MGVTAAPTVLVTGATGYLGRQLLTTLAQAGIPAAALVRDQRSWEALPWKHEAGNAFVVEGGLFDSEGWAATPQLASVKTIIHTAAQVHHSRHDAESMAHTNVEGTRQMVRVAHKLGARLVFVSSSGTVGCFKYADLRADEDAPFATKPVAQWPYYASKIAAETQARALATKLGVSLVIVRPPVLLGPNDHRFRSTGYVLKVLKQSLPGVPRGGIHFTDIRDAAAAMVRLHEMPNPRPVYHLPGTSISLTQFVRDIAEVAGIHPIERPIPRLVLQAAASVGHGAAHIVRAKAPTWLPDPVVAEMAGYHWGLSTLWSHRELGYAPRTGRQTLLDTVVWLRANHPALLADAAAARAQGVVATAHS